MADLIGVLGSSAIAVIGTSTPYTVPSGKSARVKLMYRGVAGTNSVLTVSVNGIVVFVTAALTSGNVSYSNTTQMHLSGTSGSITGATDTTTIAPGPKEYMLSEGDTVTYNIATADFSAMNFQVIGTEVENV